MYYEVRGFALAKRLLQDNGCFFATHLSPERFFWQRWQPSCSMAFPAHSEALCIAHNVLVDILSRLRGFRQVQKVRTPKRKLVLASLQDSQRPLWAPGTKSWVSADYAQVLAALGHTAVDKEPERETASLGQRCWPLGQCRWGLGCCGRDCCFAAAVLLTTA
jgi:hypothetical protein